MCRGRGKAKVQSSKKESRSAGCVRPLKGKDPVNWLGRCHQVEPRRFRVAFQELYAGSVTRASLMLARKRVRTGPDKAAFSPAPCPADSWKPPSIS